jgi:RND superfamily putative drug exporter
MFLKLGSLIVNRKKLIFSLFIVAILSAGVIGSSVFGKLDSGGYNDPKSDSSKAFEYLTDVFKVKDPAVVLVVETKDGLTEPGVVATATKLETALIPNLHLCLSIAKMSSGIRCNLLAREFKINTMASLRI